MKQYGSDVKNKYFVKWVKNRIPVIESHDKECRSIDSLEILFEEFKQAAKATCGNRDETISFGKFIIEKFGDDELNKDIIELVRKKISFIEEDEKSCVVQGDFYDTQKKY